MARMFWNEARNSAFAMKRKGIMTKDSHPDADNRLLSDSVLFMLSPQSQRELHLHPNSLLAASVSLIRRMEHAEMRLFGPRGRKSLHAHNPYS